MPGRQLPTPDFAINTVDEKDPLLPGEKSGGEEGHGGGSAFNAFFTMASACAGAGILSLPMAASSIGVLPVVLTLVVFGGINSFTLWVLATLTDLHRDELKKTQFSYEQLVLCVFGPRVGQVFSYIIVLTQFGSLTAYWVILLDLSIPVMEDNHWLTGVPMQTVRAAIAYGLAVIVLFPLSFYEKIHDLWIVVVLAIASVVWTAGILMSEGYAAHADGSAAGELNHVGLTALDWIKTLPAIVFTFNCHQQLTPVYGWTRPDVRNLVRKRVLPGAIIFCSVTYMLTAVSGYVKFGADTKGDILLNFNNATLTAEWKADSSKLLMALHVVLVYPVVLFPLLRALDSELPKTCTSKGSMLGTGARNLLVVLLTATLAIFLPDVQVVFGFVGGVLAAQSVFIFPCAMLLYKNFSTKSTELKDWAGDDKMALSKSSQTFAVVMSFILLGFGFFLVVSSLYISISGNG
eukprot:m.160568 g.160568  ORF g.160568 m.160568 type:complete len:462 (+) comp23797_c0_seq1:1374-2759(+)